MSKELEKLSPLEIINIKLKDKNNKYDRRVVNCNGEYLYLIKEEELDIVETALNEKANIENRIDEIFKNHNIKSFTELNERLCDYNDLKFDDIKQKKLKALEIIVKKKVDMVILDRALYIEGSHHYYNKEIKKHLWVYEDKLLTKNEFDLLKEVLL